MLACPDSGSVGYDVCADASTVATDMCACMATACDDNNGGYTTTRTCQPVAACPDTTPCAGHPQGFACGDAGVCKLATLQCLTPGLYAQHTLELCDESGDASVVTTSGPSAADAAPGTNDPTLAAYDGCSTTGASLPFIGAPVAFALLFALRRRRSRK